MSELVLQQPSADAPGYLRRIHKALRFQEAIENGQMTPQIVEDMVEFLADYVIEPADVGQAKDLLWNVSQAEFLGLLQGLEGENNNGPFPGETST